VNFIKKGYGGYPIWTAYTGMGIIIILAVAAIILAKRKGAV
jgi:hypothetical protein